VRRVFQGGGEMRDETNLFGSESAILKVNFSLSRLRDSIEWKSKGRGVNEECF
jgi:hypothetical protein